MAHVHNALHHATRLQAAYARALGERDEQFSGIERAGETITPVIDLWSRPEWAWLRGEELRSTVIALAAGGAGNFGEAQVHVLPATPVLFVVKKIFATVAVRVVLEPNAANLLATNDLGIAPRDFRLTGSSLTRVRSGNASAVAITERWRVEGITIPGVTGELDWVVVPGTVLRIQQIVANAAINIGLAGYQRHLLPGELE